MKFLTGLICLLVAASIQSSASADEQAKVVERLKHAVKLLCPDMEPVTAPQRYRFKAPYAEGQPPASFLLLQMPCGSGAYNLAEKFILVDENNEGQLLGFAEPDFKITYRDEEQAKLGSVTVTGFLAADRLYTATFDEKNLTITSYNRWRGLGDAFEKGVWKFINGRFVLQKYEVDPTFDDRQNPQTVYEADK